MFYETSNKKDEELIAYTAFIVGTTSCGKSGAVRQKFLVLSRSGCQLFWEKVSQLQFDLEVRTPFAFGQAASRRTDLP
eukprot:g46490.t1